jgi:hypothetical protein
MLSDPKASRRAERPEAIEGPARRGFKASQRKAGATMSAT